MKLQGIIIREKEGETNKGREIVDTIVVFLVTILIGLLILNFVGQRTYVHGQSMEPHLSEGNQVIVDKISYRFRDPSRFEVVVFPYQYEMNTYFIKRVIGLPGEQIQILDGNIYINGQYLAEDYGLEVMIEGGLATEPIQLQDDEYFLLGDNRNRSLDSRSPRVGAVTRCELLGRAWLRIWPLEDFGFIPHE